MPERIECPMLLDWRWDEPESGVSRRSRLKRERQAYWRRKARIGKMSALYEIAGDYLQFLEFGESQDIDPQAFKETLEAIEGEFEAKADNCARVIRNLIAEAEMYEKEIKRMEDAAKARKNRAEWLKRQVYDSMKATGKLKFKTDLFNFGIQKNGGLQPVEIVPDMEIPDEYCRKEPDNAKMREALKNGVELPFAALKERGDHLVIR